MAIQMTPLAGLAVRYGAAALVGFAAARATPKGRMTAPVETAMDQTPHGLRLRRARGELNGSARWQRTWRPARLLPAWRIDATVLGRLKIRRAR